MRLGNRSLGAHIILFLLIIHLGYGQVEVPLSKRTEFSIKGDFTFVSNTILGKVSNDDGTEIFDPNKSYNSGGLNNQFRMGFIDIDNDPTTFNSSSADLTLTSSCATIKHVGLYWTASYADDNRSHDITSIKIKYPGNKTYKDINDAIIIHDYYNDPKAIFKQYSCYKDITNEVLALDNPMGTYTLANIPVTTSEINDDPKLGNGLAGGWTMIVIYEDIALPRKRFYVYDGFVNIDSKAKPVEFSFNKFQTIPEGKVNCKIGLISYEGDKGIRGDRFQVKSNETGYYKSISDNTNPMNNFFNANITENGRNITTRVPASQNTLGYDADIFNMKNVRNGIIGNNQTEAHFRLMTDNDGYSVMAVAFSVEIYEPAIHIVKRSKYEDGSYVYPNDFLAPDQELFYTLSIYNDGNDNAKNTIIKDILPYNVTFSPESVKLPSKRIKFTYDKSSRTLSFSIPDKMMKTDGDIFRIQYGVRVDTSQVPVHTNVITITDRPVIAEFNSAVNPEVRYSKGYNHINKCNLPDYYKLTLAVNLKDPMVPTYMNRNLTDTNLDQRITEFKTSDNSENNEYTGENEDASTSGPTTENWEEINSGVTITDSEEPTINELINLNEIYFDFDKWDITERAEKELKKVIELMTEKYPELVIKIETHSDSRGEKEYNLILSEKRAKSIYNYLINNNISSNRILSHKGYGESQPVNNCIDGVDCNEDDYSANRRSMFIIVDNQIK